MILLGTERVRVIYYCERQKLSVHLLPRRFSHRNCGVPERFLSTLLKLPLVRMCSRWIDISLSSGHDHNCTFGGDPVTRKYTYMSEHTNNFTISVWLLANSTLLEGLRDGPLGAAMFAKFGWNIGPMSGEPSLLMCCLPQAMKMPVKHVRSLWKKEGQ